MFVAHNLGDKDNMELENELKTALEELRKSKERKFNQSVDLIVNLQKFSPKKDVVNLFVSVPHKIKEKKMAAFLEVKNPKLTTITPEEFKSYSEKKEIKKLVKNFDFFIAQASIMPKVATVFGKVLGPAGKMPSPQLGIVAEATEKSLDNLKEKINKSIKIRARESSLKFCIGKQSMKNEDIIENIMTVYNAILKALPREKDNIKNIEVKFSMTKPVKIKLK